jgi:tripeptide aminopeptidase
LESPSRDERAVADFVVRELSEVGLSVQEDQSAAKTGSNTGNLLCRIPGSEDSRTIGLCAHMDTVPLAAPVEVVRSGDVFTNKNQAILGADNKAAVAVILGVARKVAQDPPPVSVELVFTTCEEQALLGAKEFDCKRLRSEYGYVFDHASPIGEVITAAPTYYRVGASFHGKAAHAGICPEAGHNAIACASQAIAAIEFGRLDSQTTANVGTIAGGSAPNVVAENCAVELEARSIDASRATEVVTNMVDAITACASDADCDVETVVEEKFRGYRVPRSHPAVVAAAAALEQSGIEPVYIATGGGSDANAFQAQGLPWLNLANGTESNHQPDESVSVAALETMLDVAMSLVACSA